MKKNSQFWAGCTVGILASFMLLFLIFFGNSALTILQGHGLPDLSKDQLLSGDVRAKIIKLENLMDQSYVNYMEDESVMTKEARAEGLYKGLLESLGDPYSVYYTEKEYKSLSESVQGSFEGVGAAIGENKETGEFLVVSFPEDSPAREAGVQEGDIFFEVDGVPVEGMTLEELVSHVRGEKGTTVKILFLRGENREKVLIPIVRAPIETKTVSVNMLDKETGYMILSEFDTVTPSQFTKGMEELKKQGMKRLILDMRGNPGGSLDAAVKIADLILPEARIVYTKDARERQENYDSTAEESLNCPMAVLVDGRSASAAEIVAGALKDNDAAVLVGTTTFGKGIVQNVYGLADGSAVKLTSARYYTPDGTNIQGVGITPDIEVEFDSDRYEKDGYDNQLEKAKEAVKKR